MTIKENVHDLEAQILADPNGAIEEEIKAKARNAIYYGIASREWMDLMALFAKNEQQLARLIGLDGTTDPSRRLALVHLASNALNGLRNLEEIDSYLDVLDDGLF